MDRLYRDFAVLSVGKVGVRVTSPSIEIMGFVVVCSTRACATSMTVGRLPVLGMRESLLKEGFIGDAGADLDFLIVAVKTGGDFVGR